MNQKRFFSIIAIAAICVASFTTCKKDSKSDGPVGYEWEPKMIFVAGGTFTMGCTDDECTERELPAHQVTLTNDYYIGKYPVTQFQWEAIMGNNPSKFKGCDDCPVESVSWNDIQEYITKLNKMTGKNYRLPTEAEWEFAARGGNQSEGYKYSGSNDLDAVAWYVENSGNETHPVGINAPNELGIYDMTGNVLEWCHDWYAEYTEDPKTNPQGPAGGSHRILRGGSCYSYVQHCRVSRRTYIAPAYRIYHYGFRVVIVP
ncbi:MAG: formylglycine-generating enzyme family protein [Bacteroidales bacterium]|nr:formylglycine-generating enzyme family protein [Bacteroidales bacterium]